MDLPTMMGISQSNNEDSLMPTPLPSVEDQESINLCSIHRDALTRIFPVKENLSKGDVPPLERLRQERDHLKRRRIFLMSEMGRREVENISSRVSKQLSWTLGHKHASPFVRSSSSNSLKHQKESKVHPSYRYLASQMKNVRAKRKIVGAHCLSGVSLLPRRDESTIGVRLDICVDGPYTAGHVVFFRMMKDINNKRIVRLVQHTLPKGTVSQSDMSRELQNGDLGQTLRDWVGFLYDACHAHVHRRSSCLWLSSTGIHNGGTRSIQNVSSNDAYDEISFHMVLRSSNLDVEHHRNRETRLEVVLSYRKRLEARPTHGTIKRIELASCNQQQGLKTIGQELGKNEVTVLETTEENCENGALEGIRSSFLRSPLKVAVEYAWRVLESSNFG